MASVLQLNSWGKNSVGPLLNICILHLFDIALNPRCNDTVQPPLDLPNREANSRSGDTRHYGLFVAARMSPEGSQQPRTLQRSSLDPSFQFDPKWR